MSQPPAEFDPDSMSLPVDARGRRVPLSDVMRLWLWTVTVPGLPDESDAWWVVEMSDEVVSLPGLGLPSATHVQGLASWCDTQRRLYRSVRVGWPWSWPTLAVQWAMRRKRYASMTPATWQRMRQGAQVTGPCRLHDLLQEA